MTIQEKCATLFRRKAYLILLKVILFNLVLTAQFSLVRNAIFQINTEITEII